MRYSLDSIHDTRAGTHSQEDEDSEVDSLGDSTFEDEENGEYPPSSRPLLPTTKYDKTYKNSLKRDTGSKKGVKRKGERRQDSHSLSGILQVATLFLLCLVTLLGIGTCSWVGWFMYTRHNAMAQSVFSPSLQPIPQPLEPLVPPFPNDNSTFLEVQSHLDVRLLSLGLPPSKLPTPTLSSLSHFDSNSSFADRYSSLPSSGPYLIALNLYNSQSVLPTLSKTLLSVSGFLGTQNVHVSIFENGSRDNTTLALAHLAAALTSLKVEHTIVSDSRSTDWKRVDRIDQLAIYRNVALSPVTQGLNGQEFEDVLFINDVFVGPTDVLELLWQRREQESDAACAMDWRGTKGFLSRWGANSVKLYDNWVTRSITGNMLRARLDVFSEARNGVNELFDPSKDEPSRARLRNGLPLPVYSCWNGMIAMSAEPFRTIGINPRLIDRDGPRGVAESSLRPSFKPTEFRTALNAMGECAASECKTVAKDFWSRGYNRWILVPTVHVTYDEIVYSHPHLINIVAQARKFLASESNRPFSSLPSYLSPKIDWSLPEWRAPTNVVCWKWARGFHIDLPGWRSTREKAWKK
ncbi:glycosyltransferase family 69 protein [Sporobolomyces salmoneus]|uniref:glycosyltransferase family 69 protein n=1 Tax=Sporobolomyces salmoneus TaxID=183962 RepID=UPI0031704010